MTAAGVDVAQTAKRLEALYTAVVYDIMDEMGLPHQCLDLGIAPLERSMQVAGPTFTVMASPDMRERSEMPPNTKLADFGVFTQMYEGCVVVIGAAASARAASGAS